MVNNYLVVAATRAEVKYLPGHLPVVITGIGKTAAAVITAQALSDRDRRDLVVINLGSTGALRDGLDGVYLPSSVINHDMNADAIRALGYDPADVLPIEGGDGTVLASGDTFVTDPVIRARLAERAHLVDMEAYGIAYACRQYDVPLRLVKHVSDNADESSVDWPALVDRSAHALADWAKANLT
ncbi:nucleosidase [Kribbella deserti]|uniref:Nucleosidase n=1 Tax=Kribbella deserti TaxID=1926257 RepID=A0ABV6QKG4_9ACTN